MGLGHGVNFFRLGQQHATGDTAGLANGGGLHGQGLAAFGQDDPLVGVLGALDQLIAEHCRREAHLPWRAATLVQPVRVEVAGDKIRDDFCAFAVIDRDFFVELIELVGGVVRAGAHRQHGQPGLQGPTAQLHQARVRLGVAGQQQTCQRYAVHGSQADGQDDVIAVTGGYHQHAGFEQLQRVQHGAGAEDDLGHAPGFIIARIQHLRAEQLGHVTGARGIEFGLVRNAAQ